MSESDAGKTDSRRPYKQSVYDKNFQRMNGVCDECPNFLGKDSEVGQHCKLDKCSCPEWGGHREHKGKTDKEI